MQLNVILAQLITKDPTINIHIHICTSVFKTGFSNNRVCLRILQKMPYRMINSYFVNNLLLSKIPIAKLGGCIEKYKKPVSQSWIKTLFNYLCILEEH